MGRFSPTPISAREDHLTVDECYALIAGSAIGRIAVALPGESPLVVPVTFVLDRDVVVFRTAPGEKLERLRLQPVTFQVDHVDPVHRTGWSVLLRGIAYEALPGEVEHLAVSPWAPGDKDHWVRIVPHRVSGRRIVGPHFELDARAYL